MLEKGDCLDDVDTLGSTKDSETGEVVYGIFRTPQKFLEEALQTVHPFDAPSAGDVSNMHALAAILSVGKAAVCECREKQIQFYNKRLKDLQSEELQIKASMHPEVKSVMDTKRIALLREMLRDAEVNDDLLIRHMTAGFRLTGFLEPPGQFSRVSRPAKISVEYRPRDSG